MANRKTAIKVKRAARPSAKTASRKPKASSGKSAAAPRSRQAGDATVTVDRRRGARRDREQGGAVHESTIAPTRLERRQKVNRRRQIDPTTCERDYTDDEIQFMSALDDYKRTSGRMFPTCSEVLEVVRSLGYARLSPSELAARAATESPAPVATASAIADDGDESSANDWQ